MPVSTRWGLNYELYFPVDNGIWTDITALVDSRQTEVEKNGISSDLKSAVDVCTIQIKYKTDTSKDLQSSVMAKLLSAKNALQAVKFRMTGADTFFGKVDLGSLSQTNKRLPGWITLECEDNSYLLYENMPTSFEYPNNNDLADVGWPVFDPLNTANSMIHQILLLAGYSITDIDSESSDAIPTVIKRIVYDSTNERQFIDLIDTLLMECCAVLDVTDAGKLYVKLLKNVEYVSTRDVSAFLNEKGIQSKSGNYQKDGIKLTWSTLKVGTDVMLYNADLSDSVDDQNNLLGQELLPKTYWPESGNDEDVWQEFDATFLDTEYYTKQSKVQNKDLSLVSTKNTYVEVLKDDDIILANNPPELEALKARVLYFNKNATDNKYLRAFDIMGDALYRFKVNEYTYPITAKKPDEYTSEMIYGATQAQDFCNWLFLFRTFGDFSHTWGEDDINTSMFQILTVAAPGTEISTLGMVATIKKTYMKPGNIRREIRAIGVSAFNSQPVKIRSVLSPGVITVQGPVGPSGAIPVIEYSLGDADAPYASGDVVGDDFFILADDTQTVGTEGEWSTLQPSPAEGEFVWMRQGAYTPPEVYPLSFVVTRLTGSSARGIVLQASSIVIPTTSRGVVKTDTPDIVVVALLQNIPPETVLTWAVSPVDAVTLVVSGNLSRTIDVSTLATGVLSFYITASLTYLGVTYNPQLGVTVVADGLPAPLNFGGVTEVPLTTPLGEPLVAGDYFLWALPNPVLPLVNSHIYGAIYEYNGTTWVESTNGDLVMTMFDSFANLANDADSTVLGLAVVKKLVAIDAFIDSLMTNYLEVKQLLYAGYSRAGVAPVDGSGFWLHKSGLFKAKNAELIGTLRTGVDAPTNARVGIQDQSGIISGPTFTGIGLNDLLITQGGTVAGVFKVEITGAGNGKLLPATLSSFLTPETSPTGLTFDGTNLISCDDGVWSLKGIVVPSKIYIHNGVSSAILSSFAPPETSPTGLTFDGTNLISCDNSTGRIYIHSGVSSTILSSFASPGTYPYSDPTGLAFDGTNLISCDSYFGIIYIHSGVSSTILSSFASPGTYPYGLTFDGTNLISCDAGTGRIYVHDGVSGIILYDFASPSADPHGLAFDGSHLISCDNRTYRIYVHANGDRFKWSIGAFLSAELFIEVGSTFTLNNGTDYGITLLFNLAYGHTLGNYWVFEQGEMRGMAIVDNAGNEYFSASGGVINMSQEVGHVAFFAKTTAPSGYLKANGSALSRTAFSSLFDVIGTIFGAGDGSTTFNIPDLRGEFLRGLDDARGVDTGRVFGSSQLDQMESHTHYITNQYDQGTTLGQGGTAMVKTPNVSTSSAGGTSNSSENRPRNIALLACIKY